jgi:hypothetical protein
MRPLAWIALTVAAFVWLLVAESFASMVRAAAVTFVLCMCALPGFAMWALAGLEEE